MYWRRRSSVSGASGGASASGRSNIVVIKAVQGGLALVACTNAKTFHESEDALWFSSSDARLKFSADVYFIGEHAASRTPRKSRVLR